MKILNVIIITAIVFLTHSCYEDKGNYDYLALDEIPEEIVNLNNTYMARAGINDTIKIDPQILAGFEDHDLTFKWSLNYTTELNNNIDSMSVSNEKIFVIPAINSLIGSHSGSVIINDRTLGTLFTQKFALDIFPKYHEGMIILSEKNQKMNFSMYMLYNDNSFNEVLQNITSGYDFGTPHAVYADRIEDADKCERGLTLVYDDGTGNSKFSFLNYSTFEKIDPEGKGYLQQDMSVGEKVKNVVNTFTYRAMNPAVADASKSRVTYVAKNGIHALGTTGFAPKPKVHFGVELTADFSEHHAYFRPNHFAYQFYPFKVYLINFDNTSSRFYIAAHTFGFMNMSGPRITDVYTGYKCLGLAENNSLYGVTSVLYNKDDQKGKIVTFNTLKTKYMGNLDLFANFVRDTVINVPAGVLSENSKTCAMKKQPFVLVSNNNSITKIATDREGKYLAKEFITNIPGVIQAISTTKSEDVIYVASYDETALDGEKGKISLYDAYNGKFLQTRSFGGKPTHILPKYGRYTNENGSSSLTTGQFYRETTTD